MTTRGLRNKLTNRSNATLAARRAQEEQTKTRGSRRARRASDEETNTAEGEDEELAEGEDAPEDKPAARRGAKRGSARRANQEDTNTAEGDDEEFAEGEEDFAEGDDEELAEGEEEFAEGEEDFAEGEDDEELAEGEEEELAEGEDDELAEGEEDLPEEELPPVSRRSKRAKRGAKATKATGERARILAIMTSKYAAGRGRLAQFLALSAPQVSARLAINILARAGSSTASGNAPARGNSARGEAFRQAMGTVPNPRISSGRSIAQRSDEDDVFTGLAAMGQQLGLMPTQKKDR